MKIAVITGVSKGLGEALAKLFLQSQIPVVGISRTENDELTQVAAENKVDYIHCPGDLSELAEVERIIGNLSTTLKRFEPEDIYLINNAAVVNPVNQASRINNEELQIHMHLNLMAPMMLTNALLKMATDWKSELIGVTVTSGAAENPIYGWSAYSSSKAAINMYTKTVAFEQDTLSSRHKVIAFNPGIMDTNMQADIRKHSSEEFIDIDRFKAYKNKQMLKRPDEVARQLFTLLMKKDSIKNGTIY